MPTHQHQREKRNTNEREDSIRRHHGRSTGTQSFSWPIELDPSPKHLPSSFAQSNERAQQTRENTRQFTVYRDPPTADTKKLTAGADDRKGPPMRHGPAAKEVNQKLQKDRSCDATSNFLVRTEHLSNAAQRPTLEGLMMDRIEVLRPPARQMHRMSPLTEEPAPLTIRKRAVSLDDAEACPTSTTHDEPHTMHNRQNDAYRCGEMESLIAVITAQLSGISVRPRRTFKHGSSIPEPLDLSTIRAEKMKRLSLSAESLSGHTMVPERGRLYEAETESLMSIGTALALDSEGLSTPETPERVGRSRKWYKGFRRSA